MKKGLIVVCILLALFLIGSLSGYHFKETNAIPGDVKMIHSNNIGDYAKAILFEDKAHGTFGVAEIEKKFGFLYRYDGGTWGYRIEEGKPFQASGIGDNNHFLVAIKDVRADIDDYYLKEVKDNFVLFVTDEYSEDTWTIRAFPLNQHPH